LMALSSFINDKLCASCDKCGIDKKWKIKK
jgi:hypothetical protein